MVHRNAGAFFDAAAHTLRQVTPEWKIATRSRMMEERPAPDANVEHRVLSSPWNGLESLQRPPVIQALELANPEGRYWFATGVEEGLI
jgi:hypothetical protein